MSLAGADHLLYTRPEKVKELQAEFDKLSVEREAVDGASGIRKSDEEVLDGYISRYLSAG